MAPGTTPAAISSSSAAISASTRGAASATGASATSPPARRLSSTPPCFSERSPTVMRSGRPIRSASLNFTPGRLVAVVVQHFDARRPGDRA